MTGQPHRWGQGGCIRPAPLQPVCVGQLVRAPVVLILQRSRGVTSGGGTSNSGLLSLPVPRFGQGESRSAWLGDGRIPGEAAEDIIRVSSREMTMEDDTSSMVFQTGGYVAGGDFDKDLLWDGATFDCFSSFNDDKELLQQFDLAGMDNISNVNSQTSSASVSEDTESKAVVMAAASAAGLNRGGLRRAAFSMGDLQALQPSAQSSAPPAVNSYHQSSGMPLEPVIEGVQTIMTSIPTSMPQQALPMYSYPIMQPQANQPMQVAMQQQRGPEQLTSLSIEQIEAQLQRSREAAAAGNMQAQQQMMQPQQQPQQQFYSVVPQIVKTSAMYPQFQQGAVMMVSAPGQPTTMAPAAPLMAMAPPEPKPAAVGGLRRVQSAVELRRVSDDPSDPIPQFLQDETGDDGTVRIGKLTPEERRQKILRYRQKRHERNFKKKIKYVCRKTLADSRPRVRGRFARNDEDGAKPPPANGSTSAQAPGNAQAPATSVH